MSQGETRESGSDGDPILQRFSYNYLWIYFWSIVLILLLFVMGTISIILKTRTSYEGAIVIYVTAMFIFALLVNSVFFTSDLYLGNLGIRLVLFGKTWKSFGWDSIQRIRIRYKPNPTNQTSIREFWFDLRDDRKFSFKVRFDQTIESYWRLIELMNYYISEYNIPVESQIPGDEGPRTKLY